MSGYSLEARAVRDRFVLELDRGNPWVLFFQLDDARRRVEAVGRAADPVAFRF